MPQLDPTWFASQLFWLLISFIFLYAIISKLMLPSLLHVMAARKDTIDGDVAASDALTQEAEKAKAQYEQAAAEARLNARKLIDDAMVEHQTKADASMAELQEKITAKLISAEKEIASKRHAMLADLTESNAQLAELIAHKITGKA